MLLHLIAVEHTDPENIPTTCSFIARFAFLTECCWTQKLYGMWCCVIDWVVPIISKYCSPSSL